MGVDCDIYVVACHQVILHSRIGKVNGCCHVPGEVNIEDIESILPKKSKPKDDKLGGNIFHPGTFHPAAFSQHAFNNDEEGTGYKQYSFNPFTTTDPYGGTPVITRLVNVVSHFNRMIQTQPLWKTHKGFKRTKKMLEILLDDIYDDDSPLL